MGRLAVSVAAETFRVEQAKGDEVVDFSYPQRLIMQAKAQGLHPARNLKGELQVILNVFLASINHNAPSKMIGW
jgi:hypothetical protein